MYHKKIRHIFFVGIGGIGMSGIAEVLLNLGFRISGSDIRISELTRRLEGLGVSIYYGHNKGNVKEDIDVLVYSSAIKMDGHEIEAALERHIPVIPRAEMLAELMRMKYGIAVAGTHGKTTVTSIIATILSHSKMDPTVVIGGRLNSIGSNARLGKGEFLVAEADESDRSFLKLTPTIAIVTNIDPEHLDHYRDMDEINNAYLTFINKVPFYGLAILCLDHPNIQAILPEVKKRFITYGRSGQADLQAKDIRHRMGYTSFKVVYKGKELGQLHLPMPGVHNVLNSLAAIAVSMDLDIGFMTIKEALEGFSGIQRRFQVKGMVEDIMVVDDYGHHPAEIRATLRAAKEGWNRRILVVFQPHRYTRTRDLFKNFLSAFYDADRLILTDIYPAGEKEIEGIGAKALCAGIREHGHKDVVYIPEKEAVVDHILDIAVSKDMVLTMGAGDIGKTANAIVDGLNSRYLELEVS
ncbi:MAG: UDP-N-acetylmuramate--L-alanine ligase [Thermodesulfobacteriota bacterium]